MKRNIFILFFLGLMAALSVSACKDPFSVRDETKNLHDLNPEVKTVEPATDYRYSKSPDATKNLEPVISRLCAVCHAPDKEQAAFPLDTYLRVVSRGDRVRKTLEPGGTMRRYAPSDADRVILWIERGMPE